MKLRRHPAFFGLWLALLAWLCLGWAQSDTPNLYGVAILLAPWAFYRAAHTKPAVSTTEKNIGVALLVVLVILMLWGAFSGTHRSANAFFFTHPAFRLSMGGLCLILMGWQGWLRFQQLRLSSPASELPLAR